jgi:hypothetical protein
LKINNKILIAVSLFLIISCHSSSAFDLVGHNKSYLGSRYLTLGFGLGISGIAGYNTVSSATPNFGFEIDLGHEFNESFSMDFSYKFSLVGFDSPNPLDTTQRIGSTFLFNSEAFRLFYKISRFSLQPYAYVGVGAYNFGSVDSKTAMSFPVNIEMPVGIGFDWRMYKDKFSLRTGLDWHILFGENQKIEVLNLLNAKKVSFDVYSVMLTFTWYLY